MSTPSTANSTSGQPELKPGSEDGLGPRDWATKVQQLKQSMYYSDTDQFLSSLHAELDYTQALAYLDLAILALKKADLHQTSVDTRITK